MHLTKKEMYLVYVALRTARLRYGGSKLCGADRLIMRMRQQLGPDDVEMCDGYVASLVVEAEPEGTNETECCACEPAVDPMILGDLERAVDDELVVELTYMSPGADLKRTMRIRPLALETDGGIQYVRAYVHGERKVRRLAIFGITTVSRAFDLRRVC